MRGERTLVTLTGRARTRGQSRHALEAARRAAGIAPVTNNMPSKTEGEKK